jgi:SAM-dependent methyltransferase
MGADASGPMLEVARLKLPGVRFHQQGFLDLELPERFHLVTCVFDSLNNLTDPHDLERAFGRVYKHLVPGGWFAFDVNTRLGVRELWDDDRFEGEVKTQDGPAHYVWTHRYDPVTHFGHITAHCQVWTNDGLREFTEHHTERGYDPQELVSWLERAGFHGVRFLEYPDRAVPTVDSPRVWGFARKPFEG